MTWRPNAEGLAPWSVDACVQLTAHLAHGETQAAVDIASCSAGSHFELWDAVRAHDLVEFAGGTLNQLSETTGCPTALDRRIQNRLQTQRVIRQRLQQTTERLHRALDHAGVECAVLKGIPFARRYYPRTDLRASRDVDVLVRAAEIRRCLAVLGTLGFELKDRRRRPLSRHRLRTDHAISLQWDGVEVDLHWRLRNVAVYRIDESQVWNSAEWHDWGHGSCRVLSPENELLLLLISIAHDIQRGACRMKHVLDTFLLLRQTHDILNWDRFFRNRQADVTDGECLNVLDLVLKLLAKPAEFPRIRTALDARRERIDCVNRAAAMALVAGARGNIGNQQWFARISPVWHWRSVLRVLDRNVVRPGRIPWLAIKGARRLGAYLPSHRAEK